MDRFSSQPLGLWSDTLDMKGFLTFLALVLTAGLVATCSGGNVMGGGSKASENDGEGEQSGVEATDGEEGSDEPEWVNASYLTCDWGGTASNVEVFVQCGLNDAKGVAIAPHVDVEVTWSVQDEVGNPVTSKQSASGGDKRIERMFTIAGDQLLRRSIGVSIGKSKPATKKVALVKALKGMDDLQVQACFETETVGPCLDLIQSLESDEEPSVNKTLSKLRLFVSSATYSGNFGGANQGDIACQGLADAASLGNRWIAVLGDFVGRAPGSLPVKSVSGDLYFNAVGEMTGDPLMAIRKTETGGTTTGAAWTGVNTTPTILTCTNWQGTAGTGQAGAIGATDQSWISATQRNCMEQLHLYCLEVGAK